MKTKSIMSAVAGTVLLLGSPVLADHHEKVAGASVEHPVTVGHCKGATLWDFHGNKIGEIEEILLAPNDGAILIVDTSIVDDDRKIAVPWTVVNVQTKKDDADDIIYSLDTTKADLTAAPKYNGKPETMVGEVRACCTYWEKKIQSSVSDNVDRAAEAVKEGAREIEEAAEDL